MAYGKPPSYHTSTAASGGGAGGFGMDPMTAMIVSSVISGLAGLFGGGGQKTPYEGRYIPPTGAETGLMEAIMQMIGAPTPGRSAQGASSMFGGGGSGGTGGDSAGDFASKMFR